MTIEGLLKRLRLHDIGVHRRAVAERTDSNLPAFLVDVEKELHAALCRLPVPELDHLAELPRRIDLQQAKRQLSLPELFERQVKQDVRILDNTVEHHGILELHRHLPA